MARHSSEADIDRPGEAGHRGLTLAVPRSRGVLTGLLLLVAGVWGALLPLVGQYADFGYGGDQTFDLTAPRFWLQLLPGVVTVLAALVLLVSGNRVTGTFAALVAVLAGAWFVVGPVLAELYRAGYVGSAMGSPHRQVYENIASFTGLGAVIIALAALAAGRLSVVGVRDVRTAEKRRNAKDRNATSSTDSTDSTDNTDTGDRGSTAEEVPGRTANVRVADRPAVPAVPDDHTTDRSAQPTSEPVINLPTDHETDRGADAGAGARREV